MLYNLSDLVNEYSLNITGILHIGAHHGQESSTYQSLGLNNVVWFEPQSDAYTILRSSVPSSDICFNIALGNVNAVLPMYIEKDNDGQSSSFLKPLLHSHFYPHINFSSQSSYRVFRLDDMDLNLSSFNFVNLDTQGYELECLKGASQWLSRHCSYIYTEINTLPLYDQCPLLDDLLFFLQPLGFYLATLKCYPQGWGDALFIKHTNT